MKRSTVFLCALSFCSLSSFASGSPHGCDLKNNVGLRCSTGTVSFDGFDTNGLILRDDGPAPYQDQYWEQCTLNLTGKVSGSAVVYFPNVTEGAFCSAQGVFSNRNFVSVPLSSSSPTVVYVKHNGPTGSGSNGQHINFLNPGCESGQCQWQMSCVVVDADTVPNTCA